MGPINCLVSNLSSKYLLLCLYKEIRKSLEQLKGEYMTTQFWMNYPFKNCTGKQYKYILRAK